MLGRRDLLLLTVIFSSMGVGILFPAAGRPFAPYPKYFMMGLLFLSFLPLRLDHLLDAVRVRWKDIAALTAMKLILLPVAVFFVFRLVLPSYALAAMLLSGISTGVVSPFFSALVNANSPLVLAVVVVTSALVPFTLPVWVKALAGGDLSIPMTDMTRLLAVVIFLPIAAAELIRRAAPRLAAALEGRRFQASLALFAVTNAGVFSTYSEFFRREPHVVLVSLAVAMGLAVAYLLTGLGLSLGRDMDVRLSTIIVFGIMNNILVLVFSAEFFGPLETSVAATYSIPFFAFLIPLRLIGRSANE